MNSHHQPTVMTNTDQFYVRVCGCGVVHLSFGCVVVNLTSPVAIAITETLKEVSQTLRRNLEVPEKTTAVQNSASVVNNVIIGQFPNCES